MNKLEIIDELKKLNWNKDEFWVLGSASLVMRDVVEFANDIDLAITEELYNSISNDLIYLGDNHGYKWYKVNDLIECCVDNKTYEKVEDTEPYNLLRLDYYYENFIKNSTREKDTEKKDLLEKILMTREI